MCNKNGGVRSDDLSEAENAESFLRDHVLARFFIKKK
jgi:hypothetical protein